MKWPFRSRRRHGAARDIPERLVIFFGHHKVGSTSLQDFFARNAGAFARAGILYPFVDFEGAAAFSAQLLGGAAPKGRLPINIREPHNALAFRMMAKLHARPMPPFHSAVPSLSQMHQAIAQQLAQVRPHTVVLVSEVFSNFAMADGALVAEIKRLFPARSTELYGCFRRIDDYLMAWHGQRLRFGHRLEALEDVAYDLYRDTIHFDYDRIVESWVRHFPEATLHLRPYGEVLAAGGIVADFRDYIGLNEPKHLAVARRENPSDHRAFHDILRQANWALSSDQIARLRSAIGNAVTQDNLPNSGDVELLGTCQRALIAKHYETVHRQLACHSGGGKFFTDIEQIFNSRPVPLRVATELGISTAMKAASAQEDAPIRQFLSALPLRTSQGTKLVAAQ